MTTHKATIQADDARIVVIEGQQHIAIDLVPAVFADHVLAFLRDQR